MSNPLDQFASLLDAELMATKLQQHLPECVAGDWQVMGCEIQHPRYKTYRLAENRDRSFLSLVYHLRGRHPAESTAEQHILYARAYLGERSHQAFAEAQASGEQAIHLAELGMVGWRFPNDPAMPWLAELMDSQQAKELVPELGQRQLLAIEIVNYRPEIRCTARYRFAASEAEPVRVVYGKTYADERGRMVYDNLRMLQRQSQSTSAFVMPEALAYAADRRTLWLEGLPGQALAALDFTAGVTEKVQALANALADFHQLTPPHLPAITLRQQLQELQKKADKLSHAYPDIQPELSSLLAELRQNRPEFETLGLIHGDFHIDQLLVLSSGRLALFDYDELALGDPLQDLANFAADLYNYPYRVAAIDQLVQQLFTAYSAANHSQTDPLRFAWHLRGQFLTRAYRAFIQQKSAAQQRVADFIALALRPWPQAN
jgi:aminoglycoside phosphotransferase